MLFQRTKKIDAHTTDQQWWADASHAATEGNSWEALAEGQLMVDVYDRPDAVVVRSLIAGVNAEDLEISLNGDMLTLRGTREETEEIADDQFFARECYWGSFSRSIIIPSQIQPDKIKAFSKNGVVVIILPKIIQSTDISVRTEDDYLD